MEYIRPRGMRYILIPHAMNHITDPGKYYYHDKVEINSELMKMFLETDDDTFKNISDYLKENPSQLNQQYQMGLSPLILACIYCRLS